MITITNNNIYFTDFSLQDYSYIDKLEPIENENIINYLGETVELGESLTVERLFEIISDNVDYFNEIYYSVLGGYNLEPFLQEIQNNKTEETKLDYLQLHWYCEFYEEELTISPSLHGKEITDKEDISYALDFVSLNNIKECIFNIDENVFLTKFSKKTNGYKTDFLGKKSFTLFELFGALFYEITFHGGPQDKKEKFVSIEKSIKEIEDNIEESKTYTFEEMIDEYESKDIYLVKYDELRDRVDKNRIENENNLDKLKDCLKEKLKIHQKIEKSKSDNNLNKYYNKLTNIEFDIQMLYGEEEDISEHKFWLTPKCTCPKIDNMESYPSDNPFFDKKCPIHKK